MRGPIRSPVTAVQSTPFSLGPCRRPSSDGSGFALYGDQYNAHRGSLRKSRGMLFGENGGARRLKARTDTQVPAHPLGNPHAAYPWTSSNQATLRTVAATAANWRSRLIRTGSSFGHHQHVVEVPVDRRPQSRERGQGVAVLLRPDGRRHLVDRLLPSSEQRRLGLHLEQGRRHPSVCRAGRAAAASAGSFLARFDGRVNTVTRSSQQASERNSCSAAAADADRGSHARSAGPRPPCREPARRR